ncbi:MAG TPA: hypothetical protein PLY93_06370, partial [Turneriella sp.]|nr:hypothetical protein [Turneriella sp.]
MRTTYRYFLIFTFLVLGCTQANVHFPIQKGVLDLRSATIDNSFRINLDGDWEFYWQQLLTPNTFQKPHEQQFIHVPSHWSAVTLDKKNLTGMGFGTYRLNILLPPKYP